MTLTPKNPLWNLLLPALVIFLAVVIIFIGLKPANRSNSALSQYIDQEYGFSVNYPKSWTVSSISNPVQFYEASTVSGVRKLQMEIFSTPQKLPLNEYFRSQTSSSSGGLNPITVNQHSAYTEKFSLEGQEFLSYYFQNPYSPTMHILTFNSHLLEESTLVDQIVSSLKFSSPLKFTPPSLPPAASSSSETHTCPSTGWIDCLPGETAKPGCNSEFISWAGENCPGFQGVAY